MNNFLFALRFLTRLPAGRHRDFNVDEAAGSVPWFGFVGMIIGVLVCATAWLMVMLLHLPALLSAAISVAIWVGLSGALHLDGLADCADACMGGYDRERMLEIMKDSSCGVAAVVAIALVLLLKTAALTELISQQRCMLLLLPPVLGRVMMVGVLLFVPYLRSEGLGSAMKSGANVKVSLSGVAIVLCLLFVIEPPAAMVALFAAVVATLILLKIVAKPLGGATGDVYGAVCEVSETAVLIGLVAWVA